jgi:hypothetical protein
MARGPFSGTQRLTASEPLTTIVNSTTFCWLLLNGSQSAQNRIWQHGLTVGFGFNNAGLLAQVVDEGVAWRGAGFTAPTGVWFSTAVVNNAGTYSVYLNGALNHSVAGSAGAISPASFAYGNSNSTNNSINGYVGPIAVWNSALSAPIIAALHAGESPLLVSPSTLRGAWGAWGQDGAAGGEIDQGPLHLAMTAPSSPGVPNIHPAVRSPYGPF